MAGLKNSTSSSKCSYRRLFMIGFVLLAIYIAVACLLNSNMKLEALVATFSHDHLSNL